MCIVVFGDEAHIAANPAMAGSTLVDVPRYVSRAEASPQITNSTPIRAVLRAAERSILLLKLPRLFD